LEVAAAAAAADTWIAMKTPEIMAAETGSGEEEGAGSLVVGGVEAVEVKEEEGGRKGAKGGMEDTAVAQ